MDPGQLRAAKLMHRAVAPESAACSIAPANALSRGYSGAAQIIKSAMDRPLKLFYSAQQYRSHRRVALIYRRLLASQCTLVPTIEEADVVVLHHEPAQLAALFSSHPVLHQKYTVGYCVWEATALPKSFILALRLLNEIWTCSTYCATIFEQYHDTVYVVPHPVSRDLYTSDIELQALRKTLSLAKDDITFLAIGRFWDKRKNLEQLCTSFASLSLKMPDAVLVVKCSPKDVRPAGLTSNIRVLSEDLSDAQVNALYRLSSVVVSAHHAEGWGLTLSDALLFGKYVIAPRYSGNLMFLNDENSFLVHSTEKQIAPADRYLYFDDTMRWGYPDLGHLAETLLIAHGTARAGGHKRVEHVDTLERYSLVTIGAILSLQVKRIKQLLPGPR